MDGIKLLIILFILVGLMIDQGIITDQNWVLLVILFNMVFIWKYSDAKQKLYAEKIKAESKASSSIENV